MHDAFHWMLFPLGLSSQSVTQLHTRCTEAAKKALAAYNGFMQIGGGINPDNAAEWLDAGASHVIVTSYIFQDGQLTEERLQQLVRHL